MKKVLITLPLLFLVVSCGPLIGQMMKMSEGVKSFKVVEGDLGAVLNGKKIIVVGPFSKAPGAFYIARGDEAAEFALVLNKVEGMTSDIYMGSRHGDIGKTAASLPSMTGSEIKNKLGISYAPEIVLTGTILERETIVAPTRGIIMQVGYRLEFTDTVSRAKTVVEIVVKDHFRDCIETVVGELLAVAGG